VSGDLEGRILRTFALVALPSGWLFLGVPVALGVPVEPFVLMTLLVGLVLPAVLLTRSDPGASMRSLLRDCFRPSRPLWLLVPALLAIPVLSWLVATVIGGAENVDIALVFAILVNIVSSLLIVNLWEEMAWMGFFQRRAMARWGAVRGSLVTAGLFVGIHLPLAFVGVDDAAKLFVNLGILIGSSIGLRLLLAFVDLVSAGSILTVAIVHASWNATGEILDADRDWVRYVVTILLGLLAARSTVIRRFNRTEVLT
jgi:membrane protease YdiL (CAAX protease family)